MQQLQLLKITKKIQKTGAEEPDVESNISKGSNLLERLKSLTKIYENSSFNENLIEKNNLKESIFSPYRYLYITKETGKRYVFPLANSSASFGNLKSAWDGSSTAPTFMQNILDLGKGIADFVSGGVNFAQNVIENLSGNASDLGYFSEVAKCFKYSTDGDRVTTEFMLYNTTRLNSWKDNFKFLYLFYLRNLPIKIDPMTFIPPLLYDITIPAIKRLPVSVVTSIEVQPRGMIRTLSCDNFISNKGKMVVNIPEAWQVKIEFQSLLGPAANMMLAEAGAAVDINVETSNQSSS